jgi:hypothetical protein
MRNTYTLHPIAYCLITLLHRTNTYTDDDDEQTTETLPTLQVVQVLQKKVIEFCEHHLQPMTEIEKPLWYCSWRTNVQKWYADFGFILRSCC